MKLTLKFQDQDFETLRKFDSAVKRQLGPNVYVGTDYLCFYFDFPKKLSERLRPHAPKGELEVTLESSVPDARKN
ncbi:MAG TPA: hypothetical protein PKX15_04070 [Bacteroidales bacterium]|nr:hypothetical protein [Bacteroidales bacterium]